MTQHRARRAAARFARRWSVPFAVATVLLYGAAASLVPILWPGVSNLWVSIFVLVGGFTASLSALGALLADSDTPTWDTALWEAAKAGDTDAVHAWYALHRHRARTLGAP